jgi:hypothetical protein
VLTIAEAPSDRHLSERAPSSRSGRRRRPRGSGRSAHPGTCAPGRADGAEVLAGSGTRPRDRPPARLGPPRLAAASSAEARHAWRSLTFHRRSDRPGVDPRRAAPTAIAPASVGRRGGFPIRAAPGRCGGGDRAIGGGARRSATQGFGVGQHH